MPSDELQKVTMNLFRDDIAYLVHSYGHGWTTEIRRIVQEYIAGRKALNQQINAGFGDHNGR